MRHTIPTMTEVPPFLFVVTSTALVLGAAITIRGLLGFRPGADNAVLPAPVLEGEPADALLAQRRARTSRRRATAPRATPVPRGHPTRACVTSRSRS